MKRGILYLSLLSILLFSSCNNYLEVSSDSKFDSNFVFQSEFEADKAILGAYNLLLENSGIHGTGLWYDVIAVSSDIEVGPEAPGAFAGRYNLENCYYQAPQLSEMPIGSWNGIYKTINRCNAIIEGFESNKDFIATDKTKPSALTHLYGETVAIRATMYFELTREWGDVIYFTKSISSKNDYADAKLTDRDVIQEGEIAKLKEVEPMMYKLNSKGVSTVATRMTQEYVDGLIARLALIRGGYSLRPANYAGDGNVIQTHPTWGKMVRRSDYKDYYQLANTYLKKLISQGNARLITSDPRTPIEKYSNPFQYIFQQEMNYEISPEMIYEVSVKKGTSYSDRPYCFGRPSDGGSTGYPPKAYAQARIFPTFYYGKFNPKDLRRDVTVTATAQGGSANEKMVSFKKGNKSNGGLSVNKWDYCRMADKTYALKQKIDGINAPYMRLGDMVLLLAETYAVLGDEANAKTELLKIRERAFNPKDPEFTALTSGYVNSLSGNALLEAIQDERAFELAGEGQRKFDLVRWGIFGKKINELQSNMTDMINSLQTKGYYKFENGNVISNYIYTKIVKKENSGLKDILTTTCYVDSSNPLFPLLYPAWRGTATDWNAAEGTVLQNSMLAIEGLFSPLSSDRINELLAAGYVKTEWGINLQNDSWRVNTNGVFWWLSAD